MSTSTTTSRIKAYVNANTGQSKLRFGSHQPDLSTNFPRNPTEAKKSLQAHKSFNLDRTAKRSASILGDPNSNQPPLPPTEASTTPGALLPTPGSGSASSSDAPNSAKVGTKRSLPTPKSSTVRRFQHSPPAQRLNPFNEIQNQGRRSEENFVVDDPPLPRHETFQERISSSLHRGRRTEEVFVLNTSEYRESEINPRNFGSPTAVPISSTTKLHLHPDSHLHRREIRDSYRPALASASPPLPPPGSMRHVLNFIQEKITDSSLNIAVEKVSHFTQ